jgi:CTP:molybdopterin cytidylyltransferase MocA
MVRVNDPTLVILAAGRARRYGGVKQLAPIGVHGEAVIDLIASDAYAAGFGHIVVIINPDTGPLIQEHIAAHWPADKKVSFAIQERPLGTVHAVLSAIDAVEQNQPFAVANADDLYGRDAMLALGNHLRNEGSNCLVGFRLDRALVGDQPVTRGVCKVRDGRLVAIAERRKVQLSGAGFISDDGLQPRSLEADTRVSMNLWGFEPTMWATLRGAMAAASDASEESEVLLPEIVGQQLREHDAVFVVIEANSRCIGVTHADDLPIVQADVADQVARGERPDRAF